MNGATIFRLLSNDSFTKHIFDGFWFPDLPAQLMKNPALVIANTDKSTGPGEHWCAIFIDQTSGICEYFDPLGQTPNNTQGGYSFLPHLSKYSHLVEFNSVPVQSLTAITCGHHCIYFSCLKARGFPLKTIINSFYSEDTKLNDLKAFKFVRKLL
jgi:hypothetical protein